MTKPSITDTELLASNAVHEVLKELDAETKQAVIEFILRRHGGKAQTARPAALSEPFSANGNKALQTK